MTAHQVDIEGILSTVLPTFSIPSLITGIAIFEFIQIGHKRNAQAIADILTCGSCVNLFIGSWAIFSLFSQYEWYNYNFEYIILFEIMTIRPRLILLIFLIIRMYILHSVVVVGSVGVVGIVTKDNDNNMNVIRYF